MNALLAMLMFFAVVYSLIAIVGSLLCVAVCGMDIRNHTYYPDVAVYYLKGNLRGLWCWPYFIARFVGQMILGFGKGLQALFTE